MTSSRWRLFLRLQTAVESCCCLRRESLCSRTSRAKLLAASSYQLASGHLVYGEPAGLAAASIPQKVRVRRPQEETQRLHSSCLAALCIPQAGCGHQRPADTLTRSHRTGGDTSGGPVLRQTVNRLRTERNSAARGWGEGNPRRGRFLPAGDPLHGPLSWFCSVRFGFPSAAVAQSSGPATSTSAEHPLLLLLLLLLFH